MKIEHIAMYVHELEKAKEFFEKYFEAKAGTLKVQFQVLKVTRQKSRSNSWQQQKNIMIM